jgi:predicted neuraminidase
MTMRLNGPWRTLAAGMLISLTAPAATFAAEGGEAAIVKQEFIFKDAPFKACHASTIAQTPSGLVAAWFGGPAERDDAVSIWVSRKPTNGSEAGWTEPVEVADGVQNGRDYPCWNPVLFQAPDGPLLLFYKVGPQASEWWGMLMRSADGGRTWSKPKRLPSPMMGPVKNKPVLLENGTLLCPSSGEKTGWQVYMERTTDLGRTWHRTGPIEDPNELSPIQPTILQHNDGTLQILCRSKNAGRVVTSRSTDGGQSWTPLKKTALPNPNSGIDAVTLDSGRHVLAYNHTDKPPDKWGGPRTPLNVAFSQDGQTWRAALVLEDQPGEYSYPAIIQTGDGLVHVTYTWKRDRIKHVVLDPKRLEGVPMPNGQWPQ